MKSSLLFSILCYVSILLLNASKYDQSINLFNPNGRLLQVDYAEAASQKGSPIIAFTLNDTAVILTPSQPLDSLLDRRCIDKVEKIDDHIFAAYSGLAGDGRAVIRLSRSIASDFRRSFGSPPPVSFVARRIGDFQHQATLKGGMQTNYLICIVY